MCFNIHTSHCWGALGLKNSSTPDVHKTNSADQKMSLLCPVGAPNYFSRGAALVVEMNAERGRHAAFILVISGLVICGLTAYFSDHNSPTGHKD